MAEWYTLMHRNRMVADVRFDSETGTLHAVGTRHDARRIPVGIAFDGREMDRTALNTWWTNRSIPRNRPGLREALWKLNIPSSCLLAGKSLGLSLSDPYWLRPAGSGLTWEEVNFFDCAFSCDIGNVLFCGECSGGKTDFRSPDSTTSGRMKKRWIVQNGRCCLLKGGSGATQQEPYNEVLASAVMERLGIPHVTYTLAVQEDYPYSVCEDFITPETELIPAWYVMQTAKRPNHVSVYQHYLDCCEALGVPGVREAVDRMIVLDYLIVNEDRHQNNFGVVRNAETLEYLGAAPIYDSGTSLWFDKPTGMVGSGRVTCKPFKDRHEEQIKLVSSFDWLDLSRLDSIEEEWMELTKGSLFLDEARRIAVARALRWRIETLKEISRCGVYAVPGTGHDVTEDIRYSGQSEQ